MSLKGKFDPLYILYAIIAVIIFFTIYFVFFYENASAAKGFVPLINNFLNVGGS